MSTRSSARVAQSVLPIIVVANIVGLIAADRDWLRTELAIAVVLLAFATSATFDDRLTKVVKAAHGRITNYVQTFLQGQSSMAAVQHSTRTTTVERNAKALRAKQSRGATVGGGGVTWGPDSSRPGL